MRGALIACGVLALTVSTSVAAQSPVSLDPAQVARAAAARADTQPAAKNNAAAAEQEDVERAFRDLLARQELKLARQDDGSFRYSGRGFQARIDAHGGLSITDKFSRARIVFDPKPLDEVNWVTYFLRVKFDLLARLDKAFGNDPFRSVRRDFLEQTRDLRMALLERSAQRALERALRTIWLAAGASPQQKRAATWKLWAECSEDEYGEKARRRIEAYVRERCPPGSACEYTPRELERLNAGRGAKPPFAPYPPGG
jgi:hypothetical protein